MNASSLLWVAFIIMRVMDIITWNWFIVICWPLFPVLILLIAVWYVMYHEDVSFERAVRIIKTA